MAAEKLTKGRLIQIIVTFAVLIVAFTWRTIEHSSNKTVTEVTCNVVDSCQFEFNDNEYRLEMGNDNTMFRVVRSSPSENDSFVEYKGQSHGISEFISLDEGNMSRFSVQNSSQTLIVNVNRQ